MIGSSGRITSLSASFAQRRTVLLSACISAAIWLQVFDADYIAAFNSCLDEILQHGWQEYEADKEKLEKYGASFERALLNRVGTYRGNYFAWLEDFTLPTTNNLSERSLRPVKSKMKIAGQFESIDAARFYAMIRSYIETCRRKGINENEALRRLCEGDPYTVEELFS